MGMTEPSDGRQAFHIEEGSGEPAQEASPAASFDPTRLDFGHHAGPTIEELAVLDPDYLRWLERHPSGVRYRAEIHRVLGVVPYSTDWHQ
jgi:hypothetical protein